MGISVDEQLIQKYDVQGPRYTSYPTALHFSEDFETQQLISSLSETEKRPRNISLYIHIPFCRSLCWYCGCTKIISRDKNRGSRYLNYLKRELALYQPLLHPDHQVVQIHLGGGTPSFLRKEDLVELADVIHSEFQVAKDVEMGIEIDPREISFEKIKAISEAGFNRASIGVQDMNKEVQQAIHRIQPYNQTRQVIWQLRESGIRSVNVDLIYGLPKQTPELFRKTLQQTLTLSPDRFAVYSYAHVPWIKPSQKLINEADLPASDDKLRMLKNAIEMLTQLGYEYIGMDHFSKKEDELARALYNGNLQRNFQGYSTHAGVDIIGIGMSSISSIGNKYIQNTRDINEYYDHLNRGAFPWAKALVLTRDDEIRREVIMKIMCSAHLDVSSISERWQIDARKYFRHAWSELEKFEKDGLLVMGENGLEITRKGRLFVRNIAMTFDRYQQQESFFKSAYSHTV